MKQIVLAWMLTALLGGLSGPVAQAEDDPAYDAAVRLLRQSTTVSRDGRHNQLLWSLRHLEDPDLKPLFQALAEDEHPTLRINGILGLAEISPDKQVDLGRVAGIDDERVQAQLITAALDAELINTQSARQLLGWEGVDIGSKLVLATHLIKQGQFDSPDILRQATGSDNFGRRAMAHMLLLQAGDESAIEGLRALDESQNPDRDAVRTMLLEVAMRQGFQSMRPWAYAIATEPDVHPGLGLLAMRTAMRFGDQRATEMWREQYLAQQGDLAEQTRYALIALQLSPWLDPALFDPLTAGTDPFIRQAGLTGAAIARNDPNLEEQVIRLLQTYHPLAGAWALSYAREVAAPEDAHQVLLGLILVYEEGPQRGRPQRLNLAIEAAETLFQLDPQIATALLKPIVASRDLDPDLVQGILLGLVRARSDSAAAVTEGLPENLPPATEQLVLLLRARAGNQLSRVEVMDLGVAARGGGRLQDSLRMQAAWLYLKQTDRADSALSEVLHRRS